VGLDVYKDIERCMAGGWSDGLPVIPPYGSLVEDMLAAMGWYYTGAEFVSAPELNGRVLIKYGGTRFPAAPWGESAATRTLSSSPRDAVRDRYRDCYDAALTALTRRFGAVPSRLICNQITPGTVRMLARLTGLPPSAVVVSGHSVGHIGPADIIVGFDRLCRAGQLDGPVAVASSTPYAFGFGLITPPAG
jgi:hypothetical protein